MNPIVPELHDDARVLVTGGTGLVGSHVIQRLAEAGFSVRALVRDGSDIQFLQSLPVELVTGSLEQPDSLLPAVQDITHVVHCAAKVGDWGPAETYRKTNVEGLRALAAALLTNAPLKQFVHISSLGVYRARDHFGTDESEPVNKQGIDGYTLSKVESEEALQELVQESAFPAVILRPGFIYGPRDRTVLPRLLERLKAGRFAYLGSGEQLLNQIYVGNLVDAACLALDRNDLTGQVFNLTDGRLVTRKQFIETICDLAAISRPTRHVPLPLAKVLASGMSTFARLTGRQEAPLLSPARIKFLGLNLDFSIDHAVHQLGYDPRVTFEDGMARTMEWISQNAPAPS